MKTLITAVVVALNPEGGISNFADLIDKETVINCPEEIHLGAKRFLKENYPEYTYLTYHILDNKVEEVTFGNIRKYVGSALRTAHLSTRP